MKEIVVHYTASAKIILSNHAHDNLLHGDREEYDDEVIAILKRVLHGRVDQTHIQLQSYISETSGMGEVRFEFK